MKQPQVYAHNVFCALNFVTSHILIAHTEIIRAPADSAFSYPHKIVTFVP